MKTRLFTSLPIVVLCIVWSNITFAAGKSPFHSSKPTNKTYQVTISQLQLQVKALQQQLRKLQEKCQPGWGKCPNSKVCVNIQSNVNSCGVRCKKCKSYQTCQKGKCIGKLFSGGTLLTPNHMKQLNRWSGFPVNTRWRICYNSSLHGSNTSEFHKRCNQRGPSFSVLSINQDSRIIGGYAPASWRKSQNRQSGSYFAKGDTRAFLFILKHPNPKKSPFQYKHKSKAECISREAKLHHVQTLYTEGTTSGPTFGAGHDLATGLGGTIGKNAYCRLGYTYHCRKKSTPISKTGKNVMSNNAYARCVRDFCGKEHPTVDKLEVYVRW